MEKPVTMPKLGMTMAEGTILKWLYKEGDWVEKGEPLVEVMTDKVNLEVEAPFDGRLGQILAREGDTLPVGASIATLSYDKSESAKDAIAPAVVSRTSMPVASTPAAKREAALHGVELQAVVQAGAKPPLYHADVVAFVQSHKQGEPVEMPRPAVRATPVAQKIAREHRVDLAAVAERKIGEKVTRADVEAHLAEITQHAQWHQASLTSSPEQDTTDSELIPLTSVRHLIGQRMLQSITSAPHIYLDIEIDMMEAEQCRQRVGRNLQNKGEPLPSITALIVRVAAAALVLHPEVNATLEPGALGGKDAIRRWRSVHIGIAVDTEQALMTPVIRNAHQLLLPELARELRRLTLAARQGKLRLEELSSATFTISNLGMYDIDTFHAIIAPGQSAILAVGKVTKRSVVIEDSEGTRIEIRPMMKVSLSADHRVLDGASASRFLHQLKIFLEDPYLLL